MDIEIGYAWRQLQEAKKAVGRAEAAFDQELQARAEEKVAKWEDVIERMQRGGLEVGSRTPTSAPVWVTLEVVTGGFATGNYPAGGSLRPHETMMAEALGIPASRVSLNLHYLRPGALSEALSSGCYRLELPEEGALLVVQWLRQRGEDEAAEALVAELMPWFYELRFFPIPTETAPAHTPGAVRLQELAKTKAQVSRPRRQRRFEEMKAAHLVWTPLYDRALGLLLETVEGAWPTTPRAGGAIGARESIDSQAHLDRLSRRGTSSSPTQNEIVSQSLSGGHVGRRFPDGWSDRVAALATSRDHAGDAKSRLAHRVVKLITTLQRWSRDPKSVEPREAHLLRLELARHLGAHGAPGTAEHRAWRAAQEKAVAGPLHRELRKVAEARLGAQVPRDELDLEVAAAPVSTEEAAKLGVPAGSALPEYMIAKMRRSLRAPLAELAARGVLPSSEAMANLLPQVTAQVRGETLGDEAGRRLYGALYEAFRKRRGLLLINYQSKVSFFELPWARLLDERRAVDEAAVHRAKQLVADASAVAMKTFPHTITPNKLVTELYALAGAAALWMPLVEELAADIFMGSFTEKFVRAAHIAAELLDGSLYQRYYGIDADQVRALDGASTSPARTANSSPATRAPRLADEFTKLCVERAFASGSATTRSVARSGKILEQSQILTTHNLAVLYDALSLRRSLGGELRPLAERCARWVLRTLHLPVHKGHDWLIRLKNTAYAWRQMIFFVSLAGDAPGFARWVRERVQHVARRDAAFAGRFEPAVRGLELAASGLSSTSPEFEERGGRVFTGWTTERHWLSLPPPALTPAGAKQ